MLYIKQACRLACFGGFVIVFFSLWFFFCGGGGGYGGRLSMSTYATKDGGISFSVFLVHHGIYDKIYGTVQEGER